MNVRNGGLFIAYDITRSINEYLSTLPQFLKYYQEIQGKIEEVTSKKIDIFSNFTDTEFGERIQHITEMFDEGTLSHKQYFDALQSEINNFDASNVVDSIEEMDKATEQFFVDSVQKTAEGLSSLIGSFDKGEMTISEYLEGYLSIGKTLSTLTDSLQQNSQAWNENGQAISDSENAAIDTVQSNLSNAMDVISSYQDSIYSFEQIMTNAVEVGSDEFAAHANVIAEDLYRIVQIGGEMADTVANTLGTTTEEIAKNLTKNVSDQEIACEAIMANTNNAITDMSNSIGNLFDTLGKEIYNFKVDLTFGIKSIDWSSVNVLGRELKLPEIKFELGASGDSLKAIGNAVSAFGKSVTTNYTPQILELDDFHRSIDNNSKKYTPSSSVTKNYNNALNQIKDSVKSASSAV